MGIRQEAAEKLARKLLELRAPRIEPMSQKFIETMGRVIKLYVDMDEQRARSEKITEPPDAAPHSSSEDIK